MSGLNSNLSQANIKGDEPDLNIGLGKAYFWFLVLWLTQLVDVMDRMAVNAVLPMLKTTFQLTDAQSGLISSVLGIGIAVFVVPVGIMCDKWSRRKMVSLMVALWSLMTFATGRANGYIGLLFARIGVGVGEAGYSPASFSLISAWFPKSKRGTMIGLFGAAAPIGNAVGLIGASYLAYRFGWRAVFGILAVPGLILAALAWFMPDFKTTQAHNETNQNTEKTNPGKTVGVSIKDALSYIFKSPTLIMVFLISGFAMMSTSTIGTWGPTFFGRTFDMNVKDAGMAAGIASLVAFAGAPIMGWVGDKLLKYTSKGRFVAAAISAIFFTVLITLAIHSTSYQMVFICWALAIFFLFGIATSTNSVSQDLVPPHIRAIAAAFIPIGNHLIGGVWGPVIAGKISDGSNIAVGLQSVFAISMLLVIIGILIAGKFYNRDQKRLEALGTFKLDMD